MTNYNHVVEVGRLASDPRRFENEGHIAVCFFNLAVGHRFRNKEGAVQDETHYFDVVCFGAQAESVLMSMRKGSLVLVSGRLQQLKKECDCGKRHDKVSIAASSVVFFPKGDSHV